MLLPRSTQRPSGAKDGKLNLLCRFDARSSMGLWSYILRLTLLVKGKQRNRGSSRERRPARFKTEINRLVGLAAAFRLYRLKDLIEVITGRGSSLATCSTMPSDIAELVSPNSFNPGKKNLEALLLEGLVIDSCEAVAYGIVRQRVRRAGIIYVAQLDEYFRDAPVAQRHGLRYVDLARVEVGRVHPAGVIHAPDFDDVAAVRSLPSALELVKRRQRFAGY